MGMARLLRTSVQSFIPPWLSSRPQLRNGFAYLYAISLICDALYETVNESVFAAFPSVGTLTALELIGQARGFIQGPTETDAHFIKTLLNWLTLWIGAGQAATWAVLIQNYLMGQGNLGAGNFPVVRVVDRNGNWVIVDQNQNVSTVFGPAFNWDSVLGWDDGTHHIPGIVTANYWSDMFVVVAPPSGSTPVYSFYASTTDPAFVANWGTNAALGCGLQIPLTVSRGLLQIIHNWKGAHTWIRAIIFTSSPIEWSPGTVTADGTMGLWGTPISGVETLTRPTDSRYLFPPNGG